MAAICNLFARKNVSRVLCILALGLSVLYTSANIPISFAMQASAGDALRIQIYGVEGRLDQFWSRDFYSKTYVNQQNATFTLSIEKGILSYRVEDTEAYNVTLFDNLGNHFLPIISNDVLQNPHIDVDIPPAFSYRLSLSFDTKQGFSTVGLVTFYRFWLVPVAPLNLTVAFPKDYTILNSTEGATVIETYEHLELKWFLSENEQTDLSIGFLPFPTTIREIERWMILQTMTKYGISLDISEVFPQKGYVLVNKEDVYHVPASINGWKVDISNVPFEGSFPQNVTGVLVEKVWDGFGDLVEVYSPIINLTSENRGYYYVDYGNRKVWVYYRWHTIENNYEIMIGVRFKVPADHVGATLIKGVPFPFLIFEIPTVSYMSHAASYEHKTPAHSVSNITSSGEVKFLLPENTMPDISRSTLGAKQGSENGRPVVYWIIEAYGDIEMKNYDVVYDVEPLREAFSLGSVLVILTLVIAVVVSFLPRHLVGKQSLIPPLVSSFPLTFYVGTIFTAFGGVFTFMSPVIFSLFLIQLIISVFPILLSIIRYKTSQKKPNYIA